MNRLSTLALVMLAASPAFAAEKTLDRTFQVSAGGSLTVEADSASVYVSGGDSNQVKVHIVARGAEKDLADTTLESAERMLAVADAELYAAKAAGRNRVSGAGGAQPEAAAPSRARLVQ